MNQPKTWIVGIGASAGGLEAITQLISHLKPDLPFAYVVLQHLSPTYRSMMVEILARETSLAVKEATHGEAPRAGTIHVVPANHNAIYKDGRIQLATAPPEVVPKPSINQFFISLAAEEGESAIGIVLSGTGTDGVAGLRAIQAAGGYTFAQKPETAKYDGMPRAAIEAGVADYVLAPEEIAASLPHLLELEPEESALPQPADLLEQLLAKLREKLHYDFSGYKIGTLMRRIRRREIATGNPDLQSYLNWIDTHPEEIDLLARDILISVTSFFRDREAFEVLRRAIIDLVSRKAPGSEIRVWVAGCASGEEAYSIAILFADALGERLPLYRVQIFATDIDDEALNVARRGIYPAAAMSEISPDQLERHFLPMNHAYEVAKHLRDMIVFAHHNLVSDPPFLRLDLVSCRNVLIYFDAPLQAKTLQAFHFGLVQNGYLFLGRSESTAQAESLFVPVDRRERLFRKQGESQALLPLTPTPSTTITSPVQRRERRVEALLGALTAHYSLAAVLTDSDGNILYSAGEVDRYLQFPSGSVRLALADAVVSPLRGELLALLHRCRQSGNVQRGQRRKFGKGYLRIFVGPAPDTAGQMLFALFVPEKLKVEEPTFEPPGAEVREIEDELVATREHLQTLIEELATANEEMQALNEEAQASNEELQATNEELEAANEELQATNQELVSLNEELNVKTQEFAKLAEEYAHLYDALQFPIMVFDRAMQLTRFNAPAMRRFDLRQTAIRQHVSRLKLLEGQVDLERLMGHVLAHADRKEVTLTIDERTLRLSIVPGLDNAGEVVTLVVTLVDITDVVRAQAELAESQARLTALMEHTTMIFALRDLHGRFLYANRRFRDFFGVGEADLAGRTLFDLLPQPLAAELWHCDLEALAKSTPVESIHSETREEGPRWFRSIHKVLYRPDGQPCAFLVEAEDISKVRLAEEQMRITARVFDQTGEAIMVTDAQGTIQTVNAAFTKITGYTAAEAVGQKTSLLKSGRHSAQFYQRMWQALNTTGFWQGEIWNRRKDGEVYPEWLTINRILDGQGRVEHYVAVFSDISEIKSAQRKAEYLATHDPLTGLPNRALFHDRLRHALAQARRDKTRLALLFVDLDNFKTINDTLGHEVGDDLLRHAAHRLREAVRDVDTVARLGGDEFTIILPDCTPEGADRIGRRLADDLAASFEIAGRKLFVSASIGIAFYPEDGNNSSTLIRAADAAMYRAKELGKNRVEFFKADLQVKLLKRIAIESALREAIRTPDRLRLVFQPKYRIGSKRVLAGAEALLRWRDPQLGDVSPGEFIPIAEASGLIVDLSKAVEDLLLNQIASWLKRGLPVPPIAFNVSPRVLREADFAEQLAKKLAAANVPADRVQVEITEGALLENTSAVAANLDALHALGVRIAVDDFGTGYSSLSYLKQLPLAELKIDKSFVDGLGTDKEDEAIARAVLGLARALGLETVAEGVETTGQLLWLEAHGCDIAQGYLLSRPLESAIFEDLILLEASHGSESA